MADQGMTPEEKLLRIIESPGEAPRNLPRARMDIHASGLFLKTWLAHSRGRFKKTITLKAVNQAIVALCVLTSLYLIFDFWMGMPNSSMIQRLEKAAKKANVGNISIEALNPLSLYLNEATQHNIFSLAEPAAPEVPVPAQPAVSETLKNMVQTFRVVGIIWSDVPQVIIEDSKEGRTYSLNRGSMLKDVRVKEILRDRVILSYDNQEIELR
jgi:type II secretory pathway component PulC